MKFKLCSLIVVLVIAACLPGAATPGLGSSSSIPANLPPSPESSSTAIQGSQTALESLTAQQIDPTEASTLAPAVATTAYLPLVKTEPSNPPPPTGSIIADHRVVDLFESIPDRVLPTVIATKMLQKTASTGQYINGQGLNCLQGTSHPDCKAYPPGKYNRGNWTWQLWNPTVYAPKDKVDQFVSVVHSQINNYEVFGMKLCFIDVWPEGFPYYRDAMLQLEKDYPNKTFLWWTVALRPEWPSPDACQGIQSFNNQVRDFARANNKPLLDIADIESHDPNGNTCYTGCESTCMQYAGDPSNPQNGHPGRPASIRIAKAFWWLMARITGWDGQN